MKNTLSGSIETHFAPLPDPRKQTHRIRHKFLDILVIAISGVICGANDWVAVETFGKAKEPWLRTFLELPHGIPSHDTFTDVFAALSPEHFQDCFVRWVSSLTRLLPGDIVSIDGKTLRRSYDRQDSRAAIHMVSAWASRQSLVLGQLKTAEKSNEITAIPQLLEVLEVTGCLVTIDAMGCQKAIAAKIRERGADYLLALKENHPTLYQAVTHYFDPDNDQSYDSGHITAADTTERNRGRDETRRCWVTKDLSWLPQRDEWPDLRSLVLIEAERTVEGKTTLEHRYYLSSADLDAARFLEATRAHWGIENSLHWVLDVTFREDENRLRKGYGAENFATLRHLALNVLKQDTTTNTGIQNKRLKAGWNTRYLETLLTHIHT
jgi:predicted transposase YbfD/YdcC